MRSCFYLGDIGNLGIKICARADGHDERFQRGIVLICCRPLNLYIVKICCARASNLYIFGDRETTIDRNRRAFRSYGALIKVARLAEIRSRRVRVFSCRCTTLSTHCSIFSVRKFSSFAQTARHGTKSTGSSWFTGSTII
jgi:hypothetical protein